MTATILAYLMNDGPGIPQMQLELCVYYPTAAIVFSWILLKWKKWLFIPSLAAASFSALVVLHGVVHPITRAAMIDSFGQSYVIAILLSAALPFFAIALFYYEKKKSA